MKRPNLQVVTKALVRRILFDGKRAVGVGFERGSVVERAEAGREVILSAGAIGSPHILQLSAVSAPEHLGRVAHSRRTCAGALPLPLKGRRRALSGNLAIAQYRPPWFPDSTAAPGEAYSAAIPLQFGCNSAANSPANSPAHWRQPKVQSLLRYGLFE